MSRLKYIIAIASCVLSTVTGQASPFAFVTMAHVSLLEDQVLVIDVASNQIVDSIRVGSEPFSVAITPDGTRACVANRASNDVTVIDTATHQVLATIPGLSSPVGIAITPDGMFAYVNSERSNTVSVIDLSTNTIVTTVTTPLRSVPNGIAITPDGAFVYVSISPDVVVIDASSNTVVQRISLAPPAAASTSLAITPDGSQAWALTFLSSGGTQASVIDVATNSVVATIPLGLSAEYLAFTPDGSTAYMTHSCFCSEVTVVDVVAQSVIGAVSIPNGPGGGIATTPDGAFAYALGMAGPTNAAEVIDTSSNTVAAEIELPSAGAPIAIAITPN